MIWTVFQFLTLSFCEIWSRIKSNVINCCIKPIDLSSVLENISCSKICVVSYIDFPTGHTELSGATEIEVHRVHFQPGIKKAKPGNSPTFLLNLKSFLAWVWFMYSSLLSNFLLFRLNFGPLKWQLNKIWLEQPKIICCIFQSNP